MWRKGEEEVIGSPEQLQSFLDRTLESGASAAAILVVPEMSMAEELLVAIPDVVPVSVVDASSSPVRPIHFVDLFFALKVSSFDSHFCWM